ncbi:MAG: Nif11-like leader peptide family RiPP precursor [Ruminiclostridium sp.]|nr:Nif11-like leader peptide family RiPP precursor [Ruminiclostridium sp.]
MAKETAKKLIAELQENEEIKAKIAGITDPAEMVKKAVEAGYDITLEELTEAEREYKAEMAKRADELSADELEGAAGGIFWSSEENKDGKEFNCIYCNLNEEYQVDNKEWCNKVYTCEQNYKEQKPKSTGSGGGSVKNK